MDMGKSAVSRLKLVNFPGSCTCKYLGLCNFGEKNFKIELERGGERWTIDG